MMDCMITICTHVDGRQLTVLLHVVRDVLFVHF